jgi:hypothetical protein
MIDSPKTTLLNKLDDLDLNFIEGENELEFEIDDYSFTVTYSLYQDEFFNEDDENIKGGTKLEVLSINAYDNVENESIDVLVDDEIQKLFSDYYYDKVLIDDDFEPLSVNFGEFSDFFD